MPDVYVQSHELLNYYIRMLGHGYCMPSKKHYIYKCKNTFTKMLKDVGIEVPKGIETRSKCSMHAGKGRG